MLSGNNQMSMIPLIWACLLFTYFFFVLTVNQIITGHRGLPPVVLVKVWLSHTNVRHSYTINWRMETLLSRQLLITRPVYFKHVVSLCNWEKNKSVIVIINNPFSLFDHYLFSPGSARAFCSTPCIEIYCFIYHLRNHLNQLPLCACRGRMVFVDLFLQIYAGRQRSCRRNISWLVWEYLPGGCVFSMLA